MKAGSISIGETIKRLSVGTFVTLQNRLERGGSLQVYKQSSGTTHFYWRYSHQGKTHRTPIGPYDPSAPPRKLEPGPRGYSVAAALERCRELAEQHRQRIDTGGLKALQAEQKLAYQARKSEQAEREQLSLKVLLATYVAHLKANGRQSWQNAEQIFRSHVILPWPDVAGAPACELTPEHVLDMQRRLIEVGKGRTSNKLRSYLRAAYQCALDVKAKASIPVAFKAFNIIVNPAAQTRRLSEFDRADKRPFTAEELQQYWRLIEGASGAEAAALRLHLLTGGQRIQQLARLRREFVQKDSFTIFDIKGRPGTGPRPHVVPLIRPARQALDALNAQGEFVISTDGGASHVWSKTLNSWARSIVGAAIPDFTLKRVRSGVETLLAARRVSRDDRGQLQSHGLTGVQARHYDGHDYLEEKRAALETLFAVLQGKTAGDLRRRARKGSGVS